MQDSSRDIIFGLMNAIISYLSDNYWWRCFVFAKSKDEVENKLEKLREPEFREDLAPMIYWDDEYDDMKVTDDITI